MKFKVHIPGWGWTQLEGESAEALKAELEAQRPGKDIAVMPVREKKLSDTEIAALEEAA